MLRADLFVAGRWREGFTTRDLVSPYSGEKVGAVAQADSGLIDEAVAAAVEASREPLHPAERAEVLIAASRLVAERAEELIPIIVAESGFTVSDARGEVTRAVQTLRLSGEEATRIQGRVVPIDSAPGITERLGFTIRVPVGVVCAITPFNSPLNTVAHKVGPALAAGNAVLLKPASQTPATAAALVGILLDAGLPPGWIQLLHGPGSTVGEALLTDLRIDFYTFTGSTSTGEHIARTVGLRRTQLELGAISPTVVLDDADLDMAVAKIPRSSFRKAGQVCTSVQRLLVEEEVVDELVERLVPAIETLVVGDPADPATDVGPLISPADADRVESWITETVGSGAEQLTGGSRTGSILAPTLLFRPGSGSPLVTREIFGPVVAIEPVASMEEAVATINAGPFGLATGIFAGDIRRALRFAHAVRMGGVHVNETSSSRVDLMPYGGVKRSGHGKEGPRYAVEELTEERLVTISYGD